ncbi:hypothetical protein SteCoe_30052 [Stentor coeruleus]|uniref:Receptor ligand binding region domain-containing protein n=1 Tax=Stentor coeruleus TaxID=5963 RepID=A0A1R2B4F7_9CILI|nr:hypothetical protein SteCoe_30052 [Stentor coeruleus]
MNEFPLIIDATNDQSYISIFDAYSIENNIPYISLSTPHIESSFPSRFTIKSPLFNLSQQFFILIDFLNWEEFSVLYSSKLQDIELCAIIKANDHIKISSFISYSEDISLQSADSLIKTMVKAKGRRKLVIIDNSPSITTIQTAIKNRNLVKKENYFLFITEDIKEIFIDGAIIMATQGQEKSLSFNTYIKETIENTIEIINQESNDSEFLDMYSVMEKAFPDNHIKNYSLVNVQSQNWVEVGIWDKNFKIINEILYPGGINYVSKGYKVTPIRFSIANGTSELTTNEVFEIAAYWYSGAIYAVERSNALHEINNFMIELFPTDCGNMYYDPELSKACFEPILDKLGIVYLTSGWGTGALGNFKTLKFYNHYIPQITPTVQIDELGNKTLFPEFLKLTVSLNEFISSAIYLMKAFNWDAVNIIFSDDPVHYIIYPKLIAYLKNINFIVKNSADKHIFPKNYTRDDFDKYKSFFEEAKNNLCRIFFIYAVNSGHILEGLYDVGLRKGDIMILTSDTTIINTVNEDIEEKYIIKRYEFIEDSYVYNYKVWNGKLGQKLYTEISARIPVVNNICMDYDAVTVAKESVKYLIETGNDYEDLKLVEKTMRNSKTIGCLGTIIFDRDSNNRESALVKLQQILKNETTNKWFYQDFIVIDKYSSNALYFLTDVIGSAKNISSQSNYREKLMCPFDPYLRQDSKFGLIMLWFISFIIIIITMIASFFSYYFFKFDTYPLIFQIEPTLPDYVFIGNIFLSFFQLISLAPRNSNFKDPFINSFTLLSLNFMYYFNANYDTFWLCIYTNITFCIFWILICLILSKNLHEHLISFCLFEKIKDFSEIVFQLIVNLSLIPMLTMLLEVYVCKESIGDNFTDSFVSRDCDTFCYRTFHLKASIGVSIVLVTFIGLLVYLRTIWEKIQSSLHLATKPKYISILSLIQVIVVILNMNFRTFNKKYAGISVSCCIFVLFLVTLKIQPYNYKRLNRIWLLLLGIALWHSIACLIFLEIDNFFIWSLCEYLGITAIILIGGYFIKKTPYLLKGYKSVNIARLFLFEFGKINQSNVLENNESRIDENRSSMNTLKVT